MVISFLEWTAWQMELWQVYGIEHILITILGIAAAIFVGIILAKKRPKNQQSPDSSQANDSLQYMRRIYLAAGLFLIISEIYKQLFNYYINNQGQYHWDLLPFQLCSLPMYLFLWIPWVRSPKLRLCLNTFLIDFNVMGAVMLFADPSGIFYRYWTLTIHGIVWHLLVVAVGVYAGLSDLGAHQDMRGFLYGLPVYAVASAVAVGINVLLYPYGNANMFYINPYEPSIQIVFQDIAARFGILAGNITYYVAMIVGALIVHSIFVLIKKKHVSK